MREGRRGRGRERGREEGRKGGRERGRKGGGGMKEKERDDVSNIISKDTLKIPLTALPQSWTLMAVQGLDSTVYVCWGVLQMPG